MKTWQCPVEEGRKLFQYASLYMKENQHHRVSFQTFFASLLRIFMSNSLVARKMELSQMDWTSQKTLLPSEAGATAPLSCYMFLEERFVFSYGINFLSYSIASVHADLSVGNSILNYLPGKYSSLKTHVAGGVACIFLTLILCLLLRLLLFSPNLRAVFSPCL